MDWLKDRPGIQLILNTLSSVLIVLITFWLFGWGDAQSKERERIDRLEKEKAEYIYVDKKIKECSSYDLIQDERIETMRKEWREDQKEILRIIRDN